jgi:3-dehydroquinate synthase
MDSIQQDIRLSFQYPVHFTTGAFSPDNDVVRAVMADPQHRRRADLVAVIDAGVAAAHPDLATRVAAYCDRHGRDLRLAAPVLVVPGGEAVKDGMSYVHAVHQLIHDAALCRHSFVVAIGGGAVLDTVGYAAATAHRGIRLVRVPTTVLAQDDSAMGVKNGVNAFGTKNYFGTFAAPHAVICDAAFLATLTDRDWLGGVSEAVKAALIRDADFFTLIERAAAPLVARDAAAMDRVVRQSAALHLAHIAQGGDPFERGSSRPLDFGHWAAHKLEQLSGHRISHGEAVAIGIALDTTYSWLSGSFAERDWRRVIDLLRALRLPVHAPELSEHAADPAHPRSVLRGLEEFREHLGGELTILLLAGIGCPFDAHTIDRTMMVRSIDVLRQVPTGGTIAPVDSSLTATGAQGVS